jgi:hypothetical protein
VAGAEGCNAYFLVDRFIPFKTYEHDGSVIYPLTTWIRISADAASIFGPGQGLTLPSSE